jgi:hypothetical protein
MARSVPPTIVVDEYGELWPPAQCLAAYIVNYGGKANSPFNGVLVQPEQYQEEHGFFEVALVEPVVEGRKKYAVGATILCRVDELLPLNNYTLWFIEAWTTGNAEAYPDDVYNLRDALDAEGIAIKAESVATWTPAQRTEVWRYLKDTVPHPKPEVLR